MIGAYTIGKKAVTFGYKRYGVPGAIASGGVALAGYLVVRRALKSSTSESDVDSAIDAGAVKSAVEEKGLGAVTEPETLDRAIDEGAVDSPVDMGDVRSSAESETDAITDGSSGEASEDS